MSTHKDAKSSSSIDQNIVKDETNYLNSMNEAPAVRLDAEFYQADDIDGATEGVVGSGNLNYLVLQSQQTTDASALNNPFNVLRGDDIFGSDALGGGPFAGDASARGMDDFSDDDNGMALSGNAGDFSIGGLGNTGSDIPSLGAGVSAGAFDLKAQGFNVGDYNDYDETNIVNIENPPPEPPPPPPPEPPPPPPVDDVDLTLDIDTPILDVDLDTILDPIEDILGDIDIDAIIDNILPGEHGLLPDVTATVDAVLGGTQLLGIDLSDILDPLDPLVNGVTNLLDGVIDGVEGLLPQELVQPITNIVNSVLDLTGLNGSADGDTDLLLNLGAIIPGFNTLDTSLDVPLNVVELLLGDIDITVDANALVEYLGGHLFAVIEDVHHLDLEGVIDTVIGEEGILQNVGGIVPELVLGLDVATDILPDFVTELATDDLLGDVTGLVGGLLDGTGEILPVGDLLDGDILGGDVAGGLLDGILGLGNDDPQPDGDMDLTLNTGLEVLGLEVPHINLDVPLDPVEQLLGDIDIDVDLASVTDGTLVEDALGELAEGDLGGVLDEVTATLGVDADLDLLGDTPLDLEVGTEAVSDILDNLLGGGALQQPGDTDLTLDTGIEVLGLEVPDINLDVPLDIVESLVGDIDIDIDLTSITQPESVVSILEDALSGDIDGLIDDLGTSVGIDADLDILGGDVIDTVIPDIGGIGLGNLGGVSDIAGNLGDAVGSLLGGSPIPDVLPDPVGTITEGIGSVIDTTPVLGGLGGLFGGGGGGGLFG